MKKLVQQGRSERRPEAYSVRYVEGLSGRTQPGERRVSARRGGAGENCGFCIILSGARLGRPPKRAFLVLLHGLVVLHKRRGELMRPVVFRYEVERS
jgi:hypothetical protein